jgi:hypothetical protein
MSHAETTVTNAVAELTHKFSVTWFLLMAVLAVMNDDSPKLIDRLKAALENDLTLQHDPQIRGAMLEAIAMLEKFEALKSAPT